MGEIHCCKKMSALQDTAMAIQWSKESFIQVLSHIHLYRVILLRKSPTLLKLLCAGAVLFGLLFSLIPVFSGMDEDSKTGNRDYLSQSRLSQILWPLCFMFGFVSAPYMQLLNDFFLCPSQLVTLLSPSGPSCHNERD